MSLEIKQSQEKGFSVLQVSGEIDVFSAPDFKASVEKALKQGQTIAIDLQNVTYMDSTGLSVLIFALKRTKSKEGECYLVSPHPNIRKLLKITGLEKAFCIKENVQQVDHDKAH